MKNLKVRTKLVVSFLIVAIFTVAVGLVGVLGSNAINNDYTAAINIHAKPLVDAGHTISYLEAVRAEVRAAIIFAGKSQMVSNQKVLVLGYLDAFEQAAKALEPYLIRDDTKAVYKEAMTTYDNVFVPSVQQLLTEAQASSADQEALAAFMVNKIKPAVDLVLQNFKQCMTIKSDMLDMTSAAGAAQANKMMFTLIAAIAAATAISVFFALYISGLISKPLLALSSYLKRAGGEGDITLEEKERALLNSFCLLKDEIGMCYNNISCFVEHVTEVSKVLELAAAGDLTSEVRPLSERDVMGNSLKKTLDSLNYMFGKINTATTQVTVGSEQIAEGAQALAQGSTEQAATVEELSASASEIADKTKENARMAGQAAKLAALIMKDAEKGSAQMNEMINAVTEINQASLSIGRVMKVIDDIAFQTNSLALNAAVEAARAGQHGKGFAVVAEEVRNLAAKSAEAAKDTGSLIANSIEKAEGGALIAKETAASLQEIVKGINESDQLMSEIAASSEAQSGAIIQINNGIEQVTQVVQQNSATAEESAAASQELSSQAKMLEEMITEFKLKK
jgi:methyl-accepting chemotaxis protein